MPYMTKQRTQGGIIERQCRRCECWLPLERFISVSKCFNGRAATCKMCSVERWAPRVSKMPASYYPRRNELRNARRAALRAQGRPYT